MSRILRMLVTFGPMLYRMYQKYKAKNTKQQPPQNPNNQEGIGQ